MARQKRFDGIHRAFVEWRHRQPLGPYPRMLRQRALDELTADELVELGGHLGLTVAQIRRWGEPSKAALPRRVREAETAFVEVERFRAAVTSPEREAVEMEICSPSGCQIRLRGALDASLVEATVRAVAQQPCKVTP